MNKKEYWEAHVKKNPPFANEEKEIRISIKSLRRLMEEAYEKGYEHRKRIDDSFADLFRSIKR